MLRSCNFYKNNKLFKIGRKENNKKMCFDSDDIEMDSTQEDDSIDRLNSFLLSYPKKNKLYTVLHPISGSNEISTSRIHRITEAEARIKNDLINFDSKRLTTGNFKVRLYNYQLTESGEDYAMKVEFINLFTILIIFYKDYPFSPPSITYLSGSYLDIFDIEQNIKLPMLSKEKWSPVMDLNSILFSIELLLVEENQSLFKTDDNIGRKKKYNEYEELNKKYIDNNIITGIEEKLKRIKITY